MKALKPGDRWVVDVLHSSLRANLQHAHVMHLHMGQLFNCGSACKGACSAELCLITWHPPGLTRKCHSRSKGTHANSNLPFTSQALPGFIIACFCPPDPCAPACCRVLVVGCSSQPWLVPKKDETAFLGFWSKMLHLPLPDYAARRVS